MDEPNSIRDFLDFLRAFGHSWASRLSGPATVPLAFLGVFWADSPWSKTLFLVTAAGCLVYASFLVWRQERQKWQEEHLKALSTEPRLDILAAPDVSHIIRVRPGITKQARRSNVGVCVRNAGSLRATNCQLFFDDIVPDDGELSKRVLLTTWKFDLNGSAEELVPLISLQRGLHATMGDLYLNLDSAHRPLPKTFDTSNSYTIKRPSFARNNRTSV
jgi:hypothetical protein